MAGFGSVGGSSSYTYAGSGPKPSGFGATFIPGGFGGGSSSTGARPSSQEPAAMPTNSGVQNTTQILTALQAMQKPSAAAAMPQYPAQAQTLTNSSSPNSTIEGIISTLGERAKGGMGVPEAFRLSEAAQRRTLTALQKEQRQNAARMGAAGSGSETMAESGMANDAQRNMANSKDQLAYKGEMDRNNLYKDVAGIAGASENLQGQQQDRGLAQWMAQQQAMNSQYSAQANVGLQQQQIDQQAQNNLFSILTQLF